MKKVFSLVVLVLFNISLFAQGISFNHDSWQELLNKAKAENKIIFVDAFTTWCGPCKMMSKEVFTDSTVGSFYNDKFINAKIDMEKGEGLELAKTYNVRAYPSFLFVDGSGTLQHKSIGYQKAPMFITLGKTALDEDLRLGSLNAKYAAGEKNPAFLYKLAYAKNYAMEPDAEKLAEEYLGTQKDWNTPDNLDMIYEFSGDLKSPITKYMLSNKERFSKRFGPAAIDRKIDYVVGTAANSLKKDNPDFDGLKKTLVSIDPTTADQNLLKIKKDYQKRLKNWDEFAKASVAYFNKYPAIDPQEMNEAAWDFYVHVDDKKMLKEAVYWASQAVKIDNRYYCNDTLAALYTKMGNKSKANKYINKAIELAKAEGADYSETEALRSKLK